MPSTQRTVTGGLPTETAVGLALIGVVTGVLAGDPIVGLFALMIALTVYLLYRILRTLELIATRDETVMPDRVPSRDSDTATTGTAVKSFRSRAGFKKVVGRWSEIGLVGAARTSINRSRQSSDG